MGLKRPYLTAQIQCPVRLVAHAFIRLHAGRALYNIHRTTLKKKPAVHIGLPELYSEFFVYSDGRHEEGIMGVPKSRAANGWSPGIIFVRVETALLQYKRTRGTTYVQESYK